MLNNHQSTESKNLDNLLLLAQLTEMHALSVSPPADSLPRRVQVQGELAPQQLQRLRVSGLQGLLHRAEQAWPREEGQQGHHCHDCHALPTPDMMKENWQ